MSAVTPIGARQATQLQADLVELMWLGRAMDQELARLSAAGRIGLYDPVGRGLMAALAVGKAVAAQDIVFGTSRDWPTALVRGVSVDTIYQHAFGRRSVPCAGRTLPGALQLSQPPTALTAGGRAAHLAHAVGFGAAARVRQDDRVALALMGIGAYDSGAFYAALEAAACHQSQTIFVVRGPMGDVPPLDRVAGAWPVMAEVVDGDYGSFLVHAVARARARAVAGEGPTLIDARHPAVEAAPRDVLTLQAAGRLSSEAARAVKADIRRTLWAARRAVDATEAVGPADIELGGRR